MGFIEVNYIATQTSSNAVRASQRSSIRSLQQVLSRRSGVASSNDEWEEEKKMYQGSEMNERSWTTPSIHMGFLEHSPHPQPWLTPVLPLRPPFCLQPCPAELWS